MLTDSPVVAVIPPFPDLFSNVIMNTHAPYARPAVAYCIQQFKRLGICEQTARKIAPSMQLQLLRAGSLIWSRGEHVDAWKLIINGIVQVSAQGADDRLEIVDLHGPQAWFGEVPLLCRGQAQGDYFCLTDVEMLSLPESAMHDWLMIDLDFTRCLLKACAHRAQHYSEMLTLSKFGSPCARLIIGIALAAEAMLRSPSPRSGAEASPQRLALPIKQETIARYCALSRTLFSQYVQELNAAGFLETRYGGLDLLELPVWQQLLRAWRTERNVHLRPDLSHLLRRMESLRQSLADADLATAA